MIPRIFVSWQSIEEVRADVSVNIFYAVTFTIALQRFQACNLPSHVINSPFDNGPQDLTGIRNRAIWRPYNYPLTFKISILEAIRGLLRYLFKGIIMFKNHCLSQRQQLVQQLSHKAVANPKKLTVTFWFCNIYLMEVVLWGFSTLPKVLEFFIVLFNPFLGGPSLLVTYSFNGLSLSSKFLAFENLI